jgi:hypothetical protein
MNAEGAEQIKWWEALDALGGTAWTEADVEAGVRMARDCLHPDAQWLTSLRPAFVAVTREHVREVMLRQGDDQRALYIAWLLGKGPPRKLSIGGVRCDCPKKIDRQRQHPGQKPGLF